MDPANLPDAAREIVSLREKLRALRSRGTGFPSPGAGASSTVRPNARRQAAGQLGEPETRDAPDTAWSDTQWTDTVFDSGER